MILYLLIVNKMVIKKNIIINNKKQLLSYDNIYWFIFHENWKDFAYIGKNEKEFFIINNSKVVDRFTYDYTWFSNQSDKIVLYKWERTTKEIIFNDLFYEKIEVSNNTKSVPLKNTLLKKIVVARYSLKKSTQRKKYISQIDLVVNRLDSNKLEQLINKLWNISKKSRNHKKYKDIFDYLESKALLKVYYGK
jgi:hypothetical protein